MRTKFLLTVLIAATVSSSAHAHGEYIISGQPLVGHNDWTMLQISFWPVKLFSNRAVYGVNLSPGLSSYQEEIRGVSLGLILSVATESYGIHSALLCCGWQSTGLTVGLGNLVIRNRGLMIGLFNYSRLIGSDYGGQPENYVQIGVVNMAASGLQLGLVCYNPNAPIRWMILGNYSGKKSEPASPPPNE